VNHERPFHFQMALVSEYSISSALNGMFYPYAFSIDTASTPYFCPWEW
jgi:hypothetical protein